MFKSLTLCEFLFENSPVYITKAAEANSSVQYKYNIMAVHAFFDAENVDGVLGYEILNHRPSPWERLNYQRVLQWLREHFNDAARLTAVIREGVGPTRAKRLKFAKALHDASIRVEFAETYVATHSICSPSEPEIVDRVVSNLIATCGASTICYGGHDFYASFLLREKKELGARVFTLGFPEYVSAEVIAASDDVFDLENDIGGFGYPLPRVKVY